MVGASVDGLRTTVFARRRDGCGRHTGHNGEGKIPRWNDRADAERNVRGDGCAPRILDRRCGVGEPQCFASVELEEVDGSRHIGISFRPVLSDLVGEPGAELELAIADDGRGAQQQRSALLRQDELPGLECLERGGNGLLRVLGTAC